MLSERDVELAHPEAFDFVWGNLPAAKRAGFNRHLGGCRYCQGVVEEYSEIGRIIKNLPPHVEPPADLEERTVTAMVAALAGQRAKADRRLDPEDQAATRVNPIPEVHHPAEPETRVQPRPQLQPPAEPQARPMITRLPAWRRYPRLAALVAAAAAIITAAIVIPLSLGGGRITPAPATVVIPLHATAAAKVSGYGTATGRATARQDASGSWDITLTVQHLKHFDPEPWYGCWYVSRDGQQVASAGTFLVLPSGSGTLSMTSAADPRDFSTMEITIQSPSKNGALAGTVILSGQKL
jgi:hypothetical protein